MSIFKALGNLFGSDREAAPEFDWKVIDGEQDVEAILLASNKKPQVIYKHSTRCATSYFALKNLQDILPEEKERADFYMIDVLRQRRLSFYIADKLGIRHESPQVLILKNGEVSWYGSHQQVQSGLISSKL